MPIIKKNRILIYICLSGILFFSCTKEYKKPELHSSVQKEQQQKEFSSVKKEVPDQLEALQEDIKNLEKKVKELTLDKEVKTKTGQGSDRSDRSDESDESDGSDGSDEIDSGKRLVPGPVAKDARSDPSINKPVKDTAQNSYSSRFMDFFFRN